jgi:hypothetical protein
MKRIASLIALAASAIFLANCASEPVHVHHYHNTSTRTTKSASVSTRNSPENFSAVTPPSSYSQ